MLGRERSDPVGRAELDCFVALLLAMTGKATGGRHEKEYPGRRTFQQWVRLSYQERNAWVTQEECDLLGLWKTCRKPRCARDRTCRGYQFDCLWQYRAQLQSAAVRAADAKCAKLDALVNPRA